MSRAPHNWARGRERAPCRGARVHHSQPSVYPPQQCPGRVPHAPGTTYRGRAPPDSRLIVLSHALELQGGDAELVP